MMRVAMGAGLALLVAGCGGGGSQAVTTNNGSTTTTAGTTTTAPDPGAEMADPRTASGGSNDCSKNPAFVPIYTGASVSVCSATHFGNTGKDAGSVSYTTADSPAAVIAFAKESAKQSGLSVRIDTETMFSVSEGHRRGFAMFVSPQGSGAKVTVNWNNTP